MMHDVAVIIVSIPDEPFWLRACLSTLSAASGGLSVDVVVVDNGSADVTRTLVESEFPHVRVLRTENHGFAHANNRALMTVDARYCLFLNPDTEIVEGSLSQLVGRLDMDPGIGIAGCRQIGTDGELHLTMRRFPTAVRVLLEGLGSERWPFHTSWTGLRKLDPDAYIREFELDWTAGSFMLVRREALESAGWFDERLFLYSEETDLARRIKSAGWTVRHLPQMVIVHHAGKMGWSVRGYAQYAYASRVYFGKHLGGLHRRVAVAALAAGYGLRAILFPLLRRSEPDAPHAMRVAFRTALGRAEPPYERPPATALRLTAATAAPERTRRQQPSASLVGHRD